MLWVNKRPSKAELCQVHIDKKELSLISGEMRLSLMTNRSTNPWDNYLKNINKKHIRPYKAQGTIFGTEAKRRESRKKKDLDIVENR